MITPTNRPTPAGKTSTTRVDGGEILGVGIIRKYREDTFINQ